MYVPSIQNKIHVSYTLQKNDHNKILSYLRCLNLTKFIYGFYELFHYHAVHVVLYI